MKPNLPFSFLLLTLAYGLAAGSARGAVAKRPPPESDLATRDKREQTVAMAQKLAKVEQPESLADAGLTMPFNPAGFGLEVPRPVVESAPTVARSVGDREMLIALASKVQPKGTMGRESNLLLAIGKRFLRPGDKLTVNYEGQDYVLELVSFDRVNFTLRLNREEITRPIIPEKTNKKP